MKLSDKEYNALLIRQKGLITDTVDKVRLPTDTNPVDRVDLELTPYLLFPLSLVSKAGVLWVYCIAPTQSAKTLFLQLAFAYRQENERGNSQVILPDKDTGVKAFNEKFIDFVKANMFLRERVIRPESENLCNLKMKFENGTVYPGFAKSPASMNSITCTSIYLDEIRLHSLRVGLESNSIQYGEDRTTAYRQFDRGQHFGVTTPAYEGDLMEQQLHKPLTSIYWWMIPCPKCNRVQILDIYENFIWDEENQIYLPHCMCKYGCGHEFSDENKKKDLNKTGIYARLEYEGSKLESVPKPRDDRIVICRWTSEVSPFRSFKEIADKYNTVKDDPPALANFDQCWRGRFLKRTVLNLSPKNLELRINKEIQHQIVPPWTKIITAGADSQKSGFYYWVHCHGFGMSACIDADFIPCDLDEDPTDEKVSELLSNYFENKLYLTEHGERWAIGLWAIDTGGNRTAQVYNAINMGKFKKCIPCKGSSTIETLWKHFKSAKIDKGLFYVRTDLYLEKVDVTSKKESWWLYNGIPADRLRQFCNLIYNLGDKPNRYGKFIPHWEPRGQYDYLMAYVHSEVCLDMFLSNGMKPRDKLSDASWIYNPFQLTVKHKRDKQAEVSVEKVKPVIGKKSFNAWESNVFTKNGLNV